MMVDREKVARALDAVISSPASHVDLTALADAAIAAVLEQLREPTPEMWEAGRVVMQRALTNSGSVWDAMLKAAFLQPPDSSNPAE